MISIENLILVSIYSMLVIVNGFAAVLYNKAYTVMKKTRMIKSVYFLLITILIENIYFMFVAIFKCNNIFIYKYLINPVFWSIPKLILLSGLIFFINASLSPPDNKFIEITNDKIKEEK